MVTVYLPTPLRRLTNGQARAEVPPGTVDDVLAALDGQFPGMRTQLCDEGGEIKSFINVFVNGTEIRTLEGRQTPVSEGDEISIIPAMAGGDRRSEIGDQRSESAQPISDIRYPNTGHAGYPLSRVLR
jgi:molybdopterin synthase sulfur carrier subunit